MTIETIIRTRGFNEQYLDGEVLEAFIEYGTDDLAYIESHPEEFDNYDPGWEIQYEGNQFKKMTLNDYTLYVFYDEDDEPVCGVRQFP